MNKYLYSFLTLVVLFAMCRQDEPVKSNKKIYPDLSKGGLMPGTWVFMWLDLDSIDVNGNAHFKNSYTSTFDGIDFSLTRLNDSNRVYLRKSYFENLNGSNGKNYYDTCFVNPTTDSISLIVYDKCSCNVSYKPDSLGIFTGKYDPNTNSIKGYFPMVLSRRIGTPGYNRVWKGNVYAVLL